MLLYTYLTIYKYAIYKVGSHVQGANPFLHQESYYARIHEIKIKIK